MESNSTNSSGLGHAATAPFAMLTPSPLSVMRALYVCSPLEALPKRVCRLLQGLVRVLFIPGDKTGCGLTLGVEGGVLFVGFPEIVAGRTIQERLEIMREPISTGQYEGFAGSRSLGFSSGEVSCNFHAGLSRRLDDILPDFGHVRGLMEEHNCSQLVFCGHSLGGALAHMALIKLFMLNGCSLHDKETSHASYVAVSFGRVPPFCDAGAQGVLANKGLDKGLFTYLSGKDDLTGILRVEAGLGMGNEMDHQANWIKLSSTWRTIVKGRAPEYEVLETLIPPLCFVPVGQFYCLPTFDEQLEPKREIRDFQSFMLEISSARSHNPIGANFAKLQEHLARYVREELKFEAASDATCSNIQKLTPVIESCSLIFTGRHDLQKHAKILVRGRNLWLPQSWNIKSSTKAGRRMLRGLSLDNLVWSAESSGLSSLVLKLDSDVDARLICLLAAGNWQNALTLSLVTCFGRSKTCKVGIEDPWFDSCLNCVAARCMGKLLLMMKAGVPESVYSRALSDMRQLLPGFLDQADPSGWKSYHTQIHTLWENFLRDKLEKLTRPTQIMKRVGGIALVEETVSYFDALVILLQALEKTDDERKLPEGRKACYVYEQRIYADLIEKWPEKPLVAALESLGQHALTKTKQLWQILIHEKAKPIVCLQAANKHLESVTTVLLMGPRFAGKSSLIRCLMEEENIRGKESMSGDEQLLDVKEDEDEVDVAAVQATASIDIGSAADELAAAAPRREVVLVEVPGGASRLEQRMQGLEHVADLALVVVSFAGDTESAIRLWVGAARRQGRCTNITLVVNGVDRVLHGDRRSRVWERYRDQSLEEPLQKFALAANLPPENVLMTIARDYGQLGQDTRDGLDAVKGVLHGDSLAGALKLRISQARPHQPLPTSYRHNIPVAASRLSVV